MLFSFFPPVSVHMGAAVPLTLTGSGSLPLQVSLELPDPGGERREARRNKWKTRTTPKQRRVCVNVTGAMRRAEGQLGLCVGIA